MFPMCYFRLHQESQMLYNVAHRDHSSTNHCYKSGFAPCFHSAPSQLNSSRPHLTSASYSIRNYALHTQVIFMAFSPQEGMEWTWIPELTEEGMLEWHRGLNPSNKVISSPLFLHFTSKPLFFDLGCRWCTFWASHFVGLTLSTFIPHHIPTLGPTSTHQPRLVPPIAKDGKMLSISRGASPSFKITWKLRHREAAIFHDLWKRIISE